MRKFLFALFLSSLALARGDIAYLTSSNTFTGAIGTGTNYKISSTVASNNWTIALKCANGDDPSTANPVTFNIAGTQRSVISALSVTMNAGTNWMDAGATAHATYEMDYAVYIGYNATDGVVLGVSRLFGGTTYASFNTTSTNEAYCRISTITNAAATDPYYVIGRVAATLSAGAGYTWTAPTYTAANLIQYPIYESRWMTWEPSIGVSGGTTPQYSTFINKFKMKKDTVMLECKWSGDGGNEGSGAANIIGTLPYTVGAIGSQNKWAFGYGLNLNNATAHSSYFTPDATNATFIIQNEGTAGLTGNGQNNATRFMICQGEYEI